MMRYRRLGRTNLQVSEVGFGTCQLRMVPVQQAINTLVAGFERGVNVVHTSFDYGDAVELVDQAIRLSPHPVHVCSNGWGSVSFFEDLFEQACERFGKKNHAGKVQLEFFGIACPEDREIYGDDLWGPEGLVAFLQTKKQQGVLAHSFCTSHGAPKYIRHLIECGAFDAVIFALNLLGHHMLSFNGPEGHDREVVGRNIELFECAAKHDVGIMLMEVLGGGLLCDSQAFPQRITIPQATPLPFRAGRPHLQKPQAGPLLRHLLNEFPLAASVLPGTASVNEAVENALAGHDYVTERAAHNAALFAAIETLASESCSRCGQCEPLCSRQLPISWLFRASDIERTGAVSFETPPKYRYFELHPATTQSTCATCTDRSCHCPAGLEIPSQLTHRHSEMMTLMIRGQVTGPLAPTTAPRHRFAARSVCSEWAGHYARVVIQNVGINGWHVRQGHTRVHLEVHRDASPVGRFALRSDVPAGAMAYFPLDGIAATDIAATSLVITFTSGSDDTVECIELGPLLHSHIPVSPVEGYMTQGNSTDHSVALAKTWGVLGKATSLIPAFTVLVSRMIAKRKSRLERQIKTINASGLFDAGWYLTQYNDVRQSGLDPLRHYLKWGAAEGRDPSSGFSSSFYLASNPDVASSGVNPLLHYVQHGMREGRTPRPNLNQNQNQKSIDGQYRVIYRDLRLTPDFEAGAPCVASVELLNEGDLIWEPMPDDGHALHLVLHLKGTIDQFELPHAVAPGRSVCINFRFNWPLTAKPFALELDMVRQNVTTFSDLGSPRFVRHFTPAPAERPSGQDTVLDSPLYSMEFLDFQGPDSVAAKARFGLWLRCRNTGTLVWEPTRAADRQVRVIVAIDGPIVAGSEIPHPVAPGESCDVHMVVPAPATAGDYAVEISLVHEGIAYFMNHGVESLETTLHVRNRGSPGCADLYNIALRSNSAFYHPSSGVSHLADGTPMPRVLEKAKGCYVWDIDGRRYIDYTMGWGAALLGHGHDIVEAAVRRTMSCGPTLPLPHRIELELTDALCQTAEIPCAEVVAFGKNGSDVCTLAVRIARATTGRLTVLICGYHGWQDWYCEALGFPGTGVPSRSTPLVVRVDYNDTPGLLHAIHSHRANLAAVIMEPSGASGGRRMVGDEADHQFLQTAASATREAGALLIFDEIITGFRYAQGSVQKAKGIVPDMACFGKALGNGFPISALVGRREVMRAMSRAFYGPTFKGEIYSLAAAQAALAFYRAEPVAEHVQWFGQRLQDGITYLCAEAGIDATMAGPPFRCVLHFNEPDAGRQQLLRSLYIQELLRGGLITYQGVMLPSFAHTDAELKVTLDVVRQALDQVARCSAEGPTAMHRAIEIPLLTA